MKLILALVPILLPLFCNRRIINCQRKYDIYIDYMEFPFGRNDCMVNWGTFRVKKYNRTTFVLHGDIEIIRPITDDINVLATAHYKQKSGNQYIKLLDIRKKNLCSFLKKDETFYSNLAKNIGMPLGNKFECPTPGIPAGKYTFRNYVIEEDGLLPSHVGYINWLINLRLKYKNITLGGLDGWAVIKRKEHLIIKGL